MTDTVDKVGDESGFDLFRLLPVGSDCAACTLPLAVMLLT
jgi:bacterioferritin-associated ferredoxin